MTLLLGWKIVNKWTVNGAVSWSRCDGFSSGYYRCTDLPTDCCWETWTVKRSHSVKGVGVAYFQTTGLQEYYPETSCVSLLEFLQQNIVDVLIHLYFIRHTSSNLPIHELIVHWMSSLWYNPKDTRFLKMVQGGGFFDDSDKHLFTATDFCERSYDTHHRCNLINDRWVRTLRWADAVLMLCWGLHALHVSWS